jgi:hypothetical protein
MPTVSDLMKALEESQGPARKQIASLRKSWLPMSKLPPFDPETSAKITAYSIEKQAAPLVTRDATLATRDAVCALLDETRKNAKRERAIPRFPVRQPRGGN